MIEHLKFGPMMIRLLPLIPLLSLFACGPALPATPAAATTTPVPVTLPAASPLPTATPAATVTPPSTAQSQIRQTASFSGTVERGQRFNHPFSERFTFELQPVEYGWLITIRDASRPEEDLARLTPPYHFVPNPREIEGWHFRNQDNTGPNEGSVNAPQHQRRFVFSPKVGRSIKYPPTPGQVEQVQAEGQGQLTITDLALGNLQPGQKAHIESMSFDVTLAFVPPAPE